jgi:hypothetical protein
MTLLLQSVHAPPNPLPSNVPAIVTRALTWNINSANLSCETVGRTTIDDAFGQKVQHPLSPVFLLTMTVVITTANAV